MGSKNYPNFYETLDEATHRLSGTCVLYEGRPYLVALITNTKADEIFRTYLKPFESAQKSGTELPKPYYSAGGDPDTFFDGWLTTPEGKKSGWLRKHINSPKFDKFRPFPLGFINFGGEALYCERGPTRARPQGLTNSMMSVTPISMVDSSSAPEVPRQHKTVWGTKEMVDMILGKYPSYRECIIGMKDPQNINTSVAFDRKFAVYRGPIGLLFLAYKDTIIGVCEPTRITLEKSKAFLREQLQDLNIVREIVVNN